MLHFIELNPQGVTPDPEFHIYFLRTVLITLVIFAATNRTQMRLACNTPGQNCTHAQSPIHLFFRKPLPFMMKSGCYKTFLALVFFSFLYTGVYPIPEKQIDSLRNIWQNQELPDTVRMGALYDMAFKGYLYSQPDSVQYFAEDLLNKAISIDHQGFVADAHSLMGASQYLTGRFPQALSSFEESKRLSEVNGFDDRLVKVNINIGGVLLRMGQFDRALELYFESHKLLEASGDTIMATQCLHNIGLAYMNMNRYQEALEYLKRSLSVFEEIGKIELINYARGNIAAAYTQLGKLDSAIIEFYALLEIRRELNDQYGMITAHNNIAINLMKQGDVSGALDHYQKTMEISEKINDKDGVSLALGQIANTYKQIGELDSAITFYLNAIELRREMQTLPEIAILLLNLAGIEIERSQYENAIVYLNESTRLYLELEDSLKLSEVLVTEARINFVSGNYTDALQQLSNAAEIQKTFADSVMLATTFRNIGETQIKLNNLSEARSFGELALNLSLKFGGIEEKRNAYNLMYKVHKADGEFDEALSHYEVFISLRDSLNNDENKNTLMRHRLQFEFEKKELELQASQAIKDAQTTIQMERQQNTIYGLSGGALLLLIVGSGGFYIYRQRQRNKSLADSIASRDYERNRLSRELHDGVANDLFGLQMAIDNGQYAYDSTLLNQQLRRIRDDVRHISHDLSMPDIQNTSLPELAQYLVNRWRHVGRKVSLTIFPNTDLWWNLDSEKALHLYRILQEGLTNALRYSLEDKEVTVRLSSDAQLLKLEIENHYIETLVGESPSGIGLKNLQERAELIGGVAAVEMNNGRAQLQVKIPLR